MPSYFCWHDLQTSDKGAAKAFYGGLFGWKFDDHDMGPGGIYTGITAGDKMIGGVKDAQKGVPPHWVSYATTDDVDAAVERAKKAGGKVLMPGTNIPGIGRFAVLQDPQGAVILPWKGNNVEKPDECGSPGVFCWNELVTSDVAAAKRFYGEVFGWTAKEVQGAFGTYTMLQSGTMEVGGIFPKPPGQPGPAAWVGYVQSADVDKSAAQAKKLGGKMCVEPADIPGIGRFAVCFDPQGAVFALYKPVAK